MIIFATIFLIFTVGTTSAANWAVIVAGSNQFYNYRHQSDTCHAYQIMIKHGIPASNIIMMSYNDVAQSSENPFPGSLFNKPSGFNPGYDVNKDCIIDYYQKDVTIDNFVAILEGDASKAQGGTKRVL